MTIHPSERFADAWQRLDRLIANGRNQLLMPITIAEVLNKLASGDASLENLEAIRKDSYHWCGEVCQHLFRKSLSLNRSYWDKLYAQHMPVDALTALAIENKARGGIAEAYVYARLRQTAESLQPLRQAICNGPGGGFTLQNFLTAFEKDKRLARSAGPAYEVIVHALFNAIAERVGARITISVAESEAAILGDFQDFCRLLLGVDAEKTTRTIDARLYRVGGTNSQDGGVDLWANFGPAIQVKHISLNPQKVGPIVESVQAEHIVIVCRKADKSKIDAVIQGAGWGSRVQGVITNIDLLRWYDLALGPKHAVAMAGPLFRTLLTEFDDEFPLANPAVIDTFARTRGYDRHTLDGVWSLASPAVRGKKSVNK